MAGRTAPFARHEMMIAWRYLRARRADGGVSVMTWISLIGITLAVFALIATMSVRSGFRAELVDTVLGANAHVTVYSAEQQDEAGRWTRSISDYADWAERIRAVPGVTRVAPLVKGQVLASKDDRNTGVEVYGMSPEDFATIPRIEKDTTAFGDISRFPQGIALGSGVARALGATVGDKVRLVSPNGVKTPLGISPRVKAYEVVYIFSLGRDDMDRTRVYLPLDEAQSFFNKEGTVDEFEVMVADPERVERYSLPLIEAGGQRTLLWTWKDSAGAYLRALDIEDNVMFVIMAILVLIATLNIVSGLIMLVKNKGRDIGILRTIGLTEGGILRIFFVCGAAVGVAGTAAGVLLGVLFTIYIDPIFAFVNWLTGGHAWDPSIRGIYYLPARLEWHNVAAAVGLSLGLSFLVTIFPARRAARMNPVEALRYE